MLIGAMQELSLGDPWRISTDIGPVIDAGAKTKIAGHIVTANTEGRVLYAGSPPSEGHIIAPTLIKASAIAALQYEVFGPVLHIATFASIDIDNVIKLINATGYDLAFGLQSRISNWVADISKRISAGNIYVNRNQIGAMVGSQPFGVYGLLETGPKSGSPLYNRFQAASNRTTKAVWPHPLPRDLLQDEVNYLGIISPTANLQNTQSLPGPTGEINAHSMLVKLAIICAGPLAQAKEVTDLGGIALCATGLIDPNDLQDTGPIGG
jgi:RHH-type proline utilization regulon transcriptional repressor/proline dehydrogenase/delta 1-pyrroline-5-carboxylate dehydrogenase